MDAYKVGDVFMLKNKANHISTYLLIKSRTIDESSGFQSYGVTSDKRVYSVIGKYALDNYYMRIPIEEVQQFFIKCQRLTAIQQLELIVKILSE